jgi:urease beta subunit
MGNGWHGAATALFRREASRRRGCPAARRLRAVTIAFVVAAAGAAGCDESVADLAGPTTVEATFSGIQTAIFENGDPNGRSACTECHNTQFAQVNGGLDLSRQAAYASLVNVASRGKPGAVRVVPGNPASSYLVHKLEGRSDIVGVRMPISGPFLTAGQIAVISRWIELGARRD